MARDTEPELGLTDAIRATRDEPSVDLDTHTRALQQMALASQQQTFSLQSMVQQLGIQLTSLNQSISQLSTSMAMPAAPPPAPMPMAGTTGGMNVPLGLGAATFRGLQAIGRPLGAMGEAITSPFFGTPVGAPAPGQIAPGLTPSAGFLRSAAMATGLGITPEMTRFAGAGRLREMGQERLQQRFGDVALGLTGGFGNLATSLGADVVGMGAAGAMGMTGLTGMLAGGLMAMPLAAAGGAAVNEIMGQSSTMRGFGGQFARNAFRFMPPTSLGGFGNLRRPGMMQRLQVGQAMNRMSIEDLTFNERDMSDMFAGVTQQDLMRGVQNVDEVVQRFRETKETFKLIGRRMGQGLQEAAGTMGALQGIGFDVTGARGRAAVFGASSVMGLTPDEAMQRGLAVGGQFTAQGVGREMFGAGIMGAQAAQSAIATGALSNVDIAALGGREAAGQALPQLMSGFLRSAMGRSMLLAGPRARGLNLQAMMSRAGARANQDINALVDVELGGEERMREFLSNPQRALAETAGRYRQLARVYQQGNPQLSDLNALRLAMRNDMPQATGAQLTAMANMIQNMPESMRQRQTQMAREMGDEMATETQERTALLARGQRAVRGFFTPAAEAVTETVTGMGAAIGRGTARVQRAITGTEVVNLGAGLDVETLAAMRTGPGRRNIFEEMLPLPQGVNVDPGSYHRVMRENSARRNRNRIRGEQQAVWTANSNDRARAHARRMVASAMADPRNERRIAELKKEVSDPNSSYMDKKRAMDELVNVLSGGEYNRLRVDAEVPDSVRRRNLGTRRAIQEAIEQQTGISAHSVYTGQEAQVRSFGEAARERRGELRAELAGLLDLEDVSEATGFARREIVDYLQALQAGDTTIAEMKQRAVDAGLGAQVEAIGGAVGRGEDIGEILTTLRGGREGEGLLDLERRGATAERMQVVGRGLGQVVSRLRRRRGFGQIGKRLREFDVTALGTADVGQTLRMLGQLPDIMGREDIRALEVSESEVDRRFGEILRALKTVELDDGINQTERTRIAQALGENVDSTIVKNVIDDARKSGDLGLAIATALGSGAEPMQTLARRGQGLTVAQSEQVLQFMVETNKMAELVQQMTSEWQKKSD